MFSPRLVGLMAAALAVVTLALVFRPPALPWDRQLYFSLDAPPFGSLDPGAGVELNGVEVGKVVGVVEVNGRNLVQVEVDQRYASLLHADLSATIAPHGLLGTKFVDLTAGSHGALQSADVVPLSRVHVTSDLDQVLNALQPDVRQNLQVLIVELGKASSGRGGDVGDTIHALNQASVDLSTVTATLARRDQDLADIITSSEQLNRDLQYAPLDAQLRDTNRVLGGLAEVSGSIGSGIDHTAAVLSTLDVVLDGNSQNLAQVLSRSPQTLTRLETLSVTLNQLVTGVNPSLPYLMTAVVETESAFSGADANGHFVRVQSEIGTCLIGLNTGCAGYTTPAGAPATSSPSASGVFGNLLGPSASSGATASGASGPTSLPPHSTLSDQQLARLFLGD